MTHDGTEWKLTGWGFPAFKTLQVILMPRKINMQDTDRPKMFKILHVK